MNGTNIWSFILGLIFLYAQLLIMPSFGLWGVIPSLLIPWLIYLVWTRERDAALVIGFIIFLMYDSTQPGTFGFHALLSVILTVSLDQFRKPFEEESVVAKMLTLLLANLIFHLAQLLVLGVIYGFDGKLTGLAGIGFVYDLLISFVVFWLMQFLSRLRLVVTGD